MDPGGSRLPTVAPAARPPSTTDVKPRGANRSTKSTGKLQVLPDQPEPVAGPQPPSLPKPEPPKIKPLPPPQISGEDLAPESAGSTYTDEDEEETEEIEEQDAEASTGYCFYIIKC